MKRALLGLACGVALAACTTAPVPKDYTGPLATIHDTALSETSNRAQYYFLSEIDGKRIDNVLGETRAANYGRGFSLTPSKFVRDVPAQPSKLKLVGKIGYGAPIQEMINSATVYTVEKSVDVKLEATKHYVAKGVLSAEQKDVWLEDLDTGKRVE